jgi:hypothetical protein
LLRCRRFEPLGGKPLSMDLKDLEVRCSGTFQVESTWCFLIVPCPVGPLGVTPSEPSNHVRRSALERPPGPVRLCP